MLFHRGRFGVAPAMTAVFATGMAVGALLLPVGSGRPMTSIAAASPGSVAPATVPTASPRYPVTVVRVIDGDTFEARVRAWPGIEIATKVRLRNVDAPEIRGRCGREVAMAQVARDALVAMLAEGPVSIAQVSLDKYGGRVLADASAGRVSDVGTALLEAGLVRRYAGGRRELWC